MGDPQANGHRTPITIWMTIGTAVVLTLGLVSIRLAQNPESPRPSTLRALPEDAVAEVVEHEMDDEYWPCDDCHDSDWDTNTTVRDLEEDHDTKVFTHGDGRIWCLDCHDKKKRNRLHLASGKRIKFSSSVRLCTQCHVHKLADWEAGVHGKRMGHWRGEKTTETCVGCHNPHTPGFEKIEPLPPPRRPEQIAKGAVADAGGEAHDAAEGADAAPEGAGHDQGH